MSGNRVDGGAGTRTAAAGVVLLLGLFGILCTAFGAVATLVDWHQGSPNVGTDLRVTGFFACAAVALLALSRFMAARERRAPPGPEPSAEPAEPGRSVVAGLLCTAIGLVGIGSGSWQAATATHALAAQDLLFAPGAGIFLFAGIQLTLPARAVFLRHLFGALLMTSFAITFDWVAFGPGERHFTGGLSIGIGAMGVHPGEWLGRAMFAIPALAATAMAALMWARWR